MTRCKQKRDVRTRQREEYLKKTLGKAVDRKCRREVKDDKKICHSGGSEKKQI